MSKRVLPGDHLGNALELANGKNVINENDELYALVSGDLKQNERDVDVEPRKKISQLKEGMPMVCLVEEVLESKAFLVCVPEHPGEERTLGEVDAFLPVSNIRKGFVKTIRTELAAGDIVRAQIVSTKPGVEMSTVEDNMGVLVAFCRRCRVRMDLKGNLFECSSCNTKENRKVAPL